ncbi:hypothetical protein SUGI_1177790 [Cryptomeria japonica]|nr:hypothetical protein SUGI_1177790 [Cryptomeria japonica]
MEAISERCSLPRWKPTAEQLQILEALYINAYCKPSPEQIHYVVHLLKIYGDLEAKNVYYWFQNRRANDRVNKRRRSDEAIASITFKPPKIRTGGCVIGRSWQNMKFMLANQTVKDSISLTKVGLDDQEIKMKEKSSIGEERIGDTAKCKDGDNYNYENVQLPWPANKNCRRRGQALSRIHTKMEPTKRPQFAEFEDCEDRNKTLQTLQLFPLKPSNIIHRNDNICNSKS